MLKLLLNHCKIIGCSITVLGAIQASHAQTTIRGVDLEVDAIAPGVETNMPVYYVGGKFTQAGNIQAYGIAKWNGANWLSMGNIYGTVRAIAVDPSSGHVFAGGYFTSTANPNLSSVQASYIAEWDPQTSTWSPLGTGIAFPYAPVSDDKGVYTLAVDGDSLYVGGDFPIAGGQNVTNIAKWSISQQTWSPMGSLGPGRVQALLAANVTDIYWASNGVTSFWKGENNAYDLVGGQNGTLKNGAGFAAAKVGNGFSFDGTNDYVDMGASAGNFGTQDFTVEFWMKLNAIPSTYSYIMGKRSDCSNGYYWNLDIHSTGKLRLEINNSYASGTLLTLDSSQVISTGALHHIAFTRQGTNISLYVDGGLESTLTTSTVYNFTNSGAFTLGKIVCTTTGGSTYFNGMIDELTFYNRTLSGSEIQNIYSLGSAGKTISSASSVFAGGAFAGSFARWNGTSWINVVTNLYGDIKSMVFASNNTFYVGGNFNLYNKGGVNVAQWIPGSHVLSTLSGAQDAMVTVDGGVYALAYHGGDLFIAGDFSLFNISDSALIYGCHAISKWDGSTMTTVGTGPGERNLGPNEGVDGTVHALCVHPNDPRIGSGGNLIVGGEIYGTGYDDVNPGGGNPCINHIVRWNGTNWLAMPNAAPSVSIVSPTTAAYNGPTNLTISANISDDCDRIQQIEFYSGTTLLHTTTRTAGAPSTGINSWTWNNVTPGVYTLTVKVTDVDLEQAVSAPVQLTVVVPAPSGLVATQATETRIDLSWSDNATIETGYEIWRRVQNGAYELLTTVPANTTTYSDTTVSPWVWYGYIVRATSTYGVSASSSEARITTGHALLNGSFEGGTNGWTIGPGLYLMDPIYWTPSQGTNVLEIGGANVPGSYVSQTFLVTGGSTYDLTFDYACIGDPDLVASMAVTVSTTNDVLATDTFDLPTHTLDFGTYISETLTFSVPEGVTSVTVTFADQSENDGIAVDPLLDNVAITEE